MSAAFVGAFLMGLAACGGYSSSSPYVNGGDGGGGGSGEPGTVTIGAGIRFTSGHNGTANPAVDTVLAGGTVTWTWTGDLAHSVRSIGSPSFPSSGTMTGSGTYAVTFDTPGIYRYNCSEHGQAMTGTIVVLPAASSHDRTATATDPLGDTFATTGVTWDITSLTVARDAGGINAVLGFSRDVVSPLTGDPSGTIAVLDLDLDQSALTGTVATADEFRQDGKVSGLGVDARVGLADFAADGTVAVRDARGRETGRVTPVYSGNQITVRIPSALLAGDDGYVSAVAIAGAVGQPTDIVPNVGSLSLEPTRSSAGQFVPALAVLAGNTGGLLRLAAASHLRAASSTSSLYAIGRINDTSHE